MKMCDQVYSCSVPAKVCHDDGKVVPQNFTELYGKFYQLIDDAIGATNREAVLECRRHGGKLAEIASKPDYVSH